METGLGLTPEGTEDTIANITSNDLQDYILTHLTPNRVVVVGSGSVDHKQLSELSSNSLKGLPAKPKNPAAAEMSPAIFTGSDKTIRFDSMKVAKVSYAFEGAAHDSEHAFPLRVLKEVLGSWSATGVAGDNAAAKLAIEIAENHSCISYNTFNLSYKDTGLFGVSFVGGPRQLEDTMFRITYNMTRLSHEVSEEEIARAKNQAKTRYLLSLSNLGDVSEDIGTQILQYGRRLSAAEVFARIDAVTLADTTAAANYFFNDEDHVLSAVGPLHELPDYNWVRRRSFWNRY